MKDVMLSTKDTLHFVSTNQQIKQQERTGIVILLWGEEKKAPPEFALMQRKLL